MFVVAEIIGRNSPEYMKPKGVVFSVGQAMEYFPKARAFVEDKDVWGCYDVIDRNGKQFIVEPVEHFEKGFAQAAISITFPDLPVIGATKLTGDWGSDHA